MKKEKNFAWAEHLTVAFYLGLFSTPALVHSGYNLDRTFALLFKTFPTNYLLYLAPVAFYIFFKKKDLPKHEKSFSSLFINFFIFLLIYFEFTAFSENYFYTTIAILLLSLICININDITASLTLLPGLFITKLGIVYIFAAYIPVLFLMMIKTGELQSESKEKSEKRLLHIMLFAYLYIAVLTTILLYKKRIYIGITSIKPNLALADDYINMIAGIMLLLAACVLFIVRSMPVIRNGKFTEKISLILSAIYPLFFATFGTFYSLISYNFKTVFVIALLMYAMNNVQLGITYKDKVGDIMPNKLRNTSFIIAVAIVFCSFCFKAR